MQTETLAQNVYFFKNALLKKIGLRLKTFSDPESGTLSILVLFIWTSVNRKCAKYLYLVMCTRDFEGAIELT